MKSSWTRLARLDPKQAIGYLRGVALSFMQDGMHLGVEPALPASQFGVVTHAQPHLMFTRRAARVLLQPDGIYRRAQAITLPPQLSLSIALSTTHVLAQTKSGNNLHNVSWHCAAREEAQVGTQ